MTVDEKRILDEAFGKALDYVVAHKSSYDGGVVEKAIASLRSLAHDETFQAAFASKMKE